MKIAAAILSLILTGSCPLACHDRTQWPSGTPRQKTYWHTTGINGMPHALWNEEGDLRWSGDEGLFGTAHPTPLPDKTSPGYHFTAEARQPLRLAGQYHDEETGLHYNLFRYYDPWCGRFIQPDPIGIAGGLNLYTYAPNPLTWIDPLGLKCWSSARRDYWKAEAKAAPKGMYSSVNMLRMRFGLAPRIRVKELHFKTGTERIRNVSLELNHRHWPQRDGKHVDIPYNLEKVTPWEHAAKDPYRHPGSTLLEILQDIGNHKGF